MIIKIFSIKNNYNDIFNIYSINSLFLFYNNKKDFFNSKKNINYKLIFNFN